MNQVDLKTIIRKCQEEARSAARGVEGFCLELFRRALDQEEQAAWEAIADQYHRLLLTWVDPTFPQAEECANEALRRFWHALRDKPLSQHFPHIGSILAFLKRCALSAKMDALRKMRREELQQSLESMEASFTTPSSDMDLGLEQDEQRQKVENWLKAHLPDEREQLLFKLLYEQGLKPMEIHEHHPEAFPSVKEIHRTKELILRRARRALRP